MRCSSLTLLPSRPSLDHRERGENIGWRKKVYTEKGSSNRIDWRTFLLLSQRTRQSPLQTSYFEYRFKFATLLRDRVAAPTFAKRTNGHNGEWQIEIYDVCKCALRPCVRSLTPPSVSLVCCRLLSPFPPLLVPYFVRSTSAPARPYGPNAKARTRGGPAAVPFSLPPWFLVFLVYA